MARLNRITIGDKKYPVKIDMNVLEAIQEGYGSINSFEQDILGLRFIKDDDGCQVYDENGKPRAVIVEPSVKAIKLVLPLMINEGLSIEADERNASFEPVTDEQIYRNCAVGYEELAVMIHKEFQKCFATKK